MDVEYFFHLHSRKNGGMQNAEYNEQWLYQLKSEENAGPDEVTNHVLNRILMGLGSHWKVCTLKDFKRYKDIPWVWR